MYIYLTYLYIYIFIFFIDKVAKAHNKHQTDAKSNPSTNKKEKNLYIIKERKSLAVRI